MYYAVMEDNCIREWAKLRIFKDWEMALNYFSERANILLKINRSLRAIRDKQGRTVGIIDARAFYYQLRGIVEKEIISKVAEDYNLCKTQEVQVDQYGEWFKSDYTVHVEEGKVLSAEYGTWEISLKPAEDAQPKKVWQEPEHRPGLIEWMAEQYMFEGWKITNAWNVAAAEHIEELEK